MAKLGYSSILTGVLIFISYAMYQMMVEISMPLILKLALILIVLGTIVVLIKQFVDKKNEKKESEDYKKY